MKEVSLTTPLRKEDVADLKVGDVVYLSGAIYTARDMAHIRIMEYLREGKQLPVDLTGAAIFHAGPVVRRKNEEWEVIVIGPTTSTRMEPFSETLLGKLGVKAIIGKGGMNKGTQDALEKYCGVYLLAPPGCAAIQAKFVQKVEAVHWLDLGMPEAIWVIEVKNWGPLVVAMDSHGGNLFKEIKEKAVARMREILKAEVPDENIK
ncbi:MAG: FumA C-terminus/TtdB family hydratase beta subunit [Candidatus Bathyarchaeia archaeon]